MQARREKAERCRQRGQNPFANDVDTQDRRFVQAIREQFAPALSELGALRYSPEKVQALGGTELVHVLGRVMARREFGKVSFLRLRDGSGEIQLFAKQDILKESFAALSEIDVGDHIEARGSMMVTRTGELSIELTSLRLITKALRPLPDKWHGLADVDIRYRQRYLDLVSNPEVSASLRARSVIVQGIRSFLDQRGFLEVETPTLHTLIGGAAARPFTTHHRALDLDLFLRIAPELYLKRLLVGGYERVYEVGRCYRNEGLSTRHNPEFTMLELYQAYATHQTLMTMAEELLRSVDGFLEASFARIGLATVYLKWRAARLFTLAEPFERVPMQQALSRALERAALPADLLERLTPPKAQAQDETPGQRPDQGYRDRSERARRIDWPNLRRALERAQSPGERVFAAYEYLAEPFLCEDYLSQDGNMSRPVFITDYPTELSPLARKRESDPSLVDRFELFVHSREVGNGFSELNDPDDQAERFQAQVSAKASGAEETMDYDADYVRALEHGMPPAAGFGLGVDRVVMALTNEPSIRDVIFFPLLRPEE